MDADDPRYEVPSERRGDVTPMMGTREQGFYGATLGHGLDGTRGMVHTTLQGGGGGGQRMPVLAGRNLAIEESEDGPVDNYRVSILLRKNMQMAKAEEQLSAIQAKRDTVHQALMRLEAKAQALLAKQRDIKGDLEVYTQRQGELVEEIKHDAEFFAAPVDVNGVEPAAADEGAGAADDGADMDVAQEGEGEPASGGDVDDSSSVVPYTGEGDAGTSEGDAGEPTSEGDAGQGEHEGPP
jgi:hypothetical protein